jgi:arylsulfatase A
MRVGEWKVLAKLDVPPLKPSADILDEEMHALKTAKLAEFELYNLREDLSEMNDLADHEPEKLEQLVEQLRVVYSEVQAESPVWPTWEWPRYESQRIEWPSYRKSPPK